MHQLTCTNPFLRAAGVGGGPTPGFTQIRVSGVLSSAAVTLVSESCADSQLDRTKIISIDRKGIYGLACCDPAARSQGARRQIRLLTSSKNGMHKSFQLLTRP